MDLGSLQFSPLWKCFWCRSVCISSSLLLTISYTLFLEIKSAASRSWYLSGKEFGNANQFTFAPAGSICVPTSWRARPGAPSFCASAPHDMIFHRAAAFLTTTLKGCIRSHRFYPSHYRHQFFIFSTMKKLYSYFPHFVVFFIPKREDYWEKCCNVCGKLICLY